LTDTMEHRARKRFGQNFLHDPLVIDRIHAAIDARPGERLVEIGPGQGAITARLLTRAGALDVIELDRDLIEPLRQRLGGLGELRIHNADALDFDLRALADTEAQSASLRLVGNLPYNISTPLLFHFLDQLDVLRDLHLMLQKEVVDRIVAEPGDKTYGRLSVMVQSRCQATSLFRIGPGAFKPAPRSNRPFCVCVRCDRFRIPSRIPGSMAGSSPPPSVNDARRCATVCPDSSRRNSLRRLESIQADVPRN
jgi:16S rRNA (adenine1518-N6/adenine1519-N6)-dimethyltransferase